MNQRRASKYANLRNKRWAMAGKAFLALNRLNHRGFFTADVGSCTPAQIDITRLNNAGVFQRLDLGCEDFQHGWIFVAHVDECCFCFYGPGRDQHAFKEQVRGPLKVVAVLECPRFAFVTIHSKVPRTAFCADERPFTA